MKKLKLTILLFLSIFAFIGCAHYPTNAKLDNFDKDTGYRFQNLLSQENSDSLFVILAFSGGGTPYPKLTMEQFTSKNQVERSRV